MLRSENCFSARLQFPLSKPVPLPIKPSHIVQGLFLVTHWKRLVSVVGSFSELSKSLDSLLNDVGSHRDSMYTNSSHGDDVTATTAQPGGRDRRSIHALGKIRKLFCASDQSWAPLKKKKRLTKTPWTCFVILTTWVVVVEQIHAVSFAWLPVGSRRCLERKN